MNISKKISLFLVFLSLALFLYIFYKSEIVFSGERLTYYVTYYLISILFFIFSIFIFLINNELRIKLILMFFSIIFSIYCVELFLIFKNRSLIFNKQIIDNEINIPKDTQGRTKKELYIELKKKNSEVNLYVPPIKLISDSDNIFPLTSISHVETISCNENGFFPIYLSDRYGFNNPDTEWDKDSLEFLLIGDSFAHGDCVNEEDSLSGQLRSIVNSNHSIISLGHSGNGPLLEFASLKEYYPKDKKVRNVIWLYYEGNDLINLLNEKKSKILLNYLDDQNFSQDLKSQQNKIDKMILDYFLRAYKNSNQNKNELKKNNVKNYFLTFLKIQELRVNIIDRFFESIDSDFSKILSLSNTFLKKNDTRLFFVYIPEYYRYKNEVIIQNSSRKYKKILKIVKNLEIPIIDLKELIENKDDPLSYYSENGVHFNEKGYNFAASEIYSRIKN